MFKEKTFTKSLILILMGLTLTSCAKIDYNDQNALDTLKSSEVDKIVLEYFDNTVEIESNDKNFNEIIELGSKVKLNSKSNKKYLGGNVIFAKFYKQDKTMLMLEVRDNHIFVNSVLYKYKKDSKETAKELENILASYFEIR